MQLGGACRGFGVLGLYSVIDTEEKKFSISLVQCKSGVKVSLVLSIRRRKKENKIKK